MLPEAITIDYGADTGTRLKHFSRAADVDYWTERWRSARAVTYTRELRGHLPHQLRTTWRRWVAPGASVLEAGCGLGHFTVAAHALGYRAEGLDWSEPTIGRLQERFPSIPWHVGDVRRLPFRDGTFDSVYSPGVCEHFEDGPGTVLAETHRVLRDGGIAVVSSPCFNVWLQRRIAAFVSPGVPGDAAFHEYAFSPIGMAQLLDRMGFALLQIRPYGTLDTLVRYGGWHVPGWSKNAIALLFDYLPACRDWGSTCLWIVQKR
jgi:SAM-dependent methyltransferase